MTKENKWIVTGVVVAVLVIAFLALNPFVIIGAGQRGVVTRWGAVQDKIMDEGFHVRVPVMEQVHKIDVRIQKAETQKASAASKDLQVVTTDIAVNYHQDPGQVNKIYQEIGREFKARIIDPAVQEGLKASTAQFTAEELITQRPIVKEKIVDILKTRLEKYGLIVDEISITEFDFSKAYNDAIEAKQVAEQKAKEAEWKLAEVRVAAQQQVAQAEAEAKAITVKASAEAGAIKIKGEALRQNPLLIELEAVLRWNGVLPTLMGGGVVPFVDINKITEGKEK